MSGSDVRTAVVAALATLLGACALNPVFSSGDWLPPIAAVVLTVLAGGLLLRGGGAALRSALLGRRPATGRWAALGVALVPVGQLLLVVCLLTALYAPGEALAGVLPTPASLTELAAVLNDGSAEMQEQATPALPLTGLLALTTVLVALVAVTVDLVAVAGRQPALAGVGLLVLYCVPVSTIVGGIGLVALVAPAIGMALLLWVGQRERLGLGDRTAGRLLGIGAAGALRIGTAALLAGLVLGSIVPTLAEGSLTTGLGGGSGNSTGTALDPAAALHGELTRERPEDLLGIETTAPDPGYLRAVVLDRYESEGGWSLSNLDGEISVADEDRLAPLRFDQARRPVSGTITVLAHDDRFLPVFTSPQTVRVLDGSSDDWRFDEPTGTVFGREATTGGLSYWVSAEQARPSPELLATAAALPLDSAVRQRFTDLPPLDPRVNDVLTEIIAGVGVNEPYERVRRIHAYLTDRSRGFVYSLATEPGTSGDDLVDFLRLRRGYCEQYAGAMAVLVRAAGVPARVALGYTPGTVQPDGNRIVTTDDAHAWVEVFFDDLGWVPFDPTPIAEGRAADLPWAPRTGEEQQTENPQAAPAPSAPSQTGPQAIPDLGEEAAAPSVTGQDDGVSLRPVLIGGGVGLLALAALVLPATVRALQRRRRLADGRAGPLWDELGATAADLGVRLQSAWTPRRTADELIRLMSPTGRRPDPEAVAAVRRLAHAEEGASYGPSPDRGAGAELADALRVARRALRSAADRKIRLRALLWPPSLVAGAGSRVVAGFRQRLAAGVRRWRSPRPARPA
jgi:transglutaminase-like putative cysteine protease